MIRWLGAALAAVMAAIAPGFHTGRDADPEAADFALVFTASVAREGTPPALLRDIVGNPFRPAAVDPTVLRWHGDAAARLAGAVYAEGAFDRLPVLADMLEQAGCADAGLLGHLRAPGPHVRGCWALDLVLGKG